MKLKQIYSTILKESDYRRMHTAATNEDAPLYDLTLNGVYPEDVYSSRGFEYYANSGNTFIDRECYNLVISHRGKPNSEVTIYRAMPDFQHETKAKINDIQELYNYVYTYGFAPMRDRIGTKVKLKTSPNYYTPIIDKFSEFGSDRGKYLSYLKTLLSDLKLDPTKKSKINPGDWVTISKKYAQEHMDGEKNWIIVSKKVKASQIYTAGDSWAEWGYVPN